MKKKPGAALKNLVLITEVGLSFILPLVIALFFGRWLDEKTENRFFLVLFLILGFAAGITSAVHLIRRFAPKKADDVQEETYDLMAEWKDGEEGEKEDRDPEDESLL